MALEALDDLAATVQSVCGAPTAMIAVSGEPLRRWGADPGEGDWLGRIHACLTASAQPGPAAPRILAIGDLLDDRQFGAVRRKAGPGGARALLGASLVWEGEVLGCLAALDPRPRIWSPEAGEGILRLARMAAALIGLQTGHHAAQARERLLHGQLADAARDSDILAVLTDGVVLHAADGRLIDANPSAAGILGVSRDVLLGRTAADPRWRATTESGEPLTADNHPTLQVVRTGRPVRGFVVSIEAPEQGRRWLRVNAEPLFGAGPDAPATQVVATFSDITSQVEAQDRQAALIADLEAARQATAAGLEAAEAHSRAKSAFLANMSHELRTPLNGVVGVIDALARTDLAPGQRDMVRLVADSAQALERILSDVLDLSRIEARKLRLEEAELRADEVVQSVCDTLRLRAVEKRLSFELRIGEGADERLLGDAVRIRQVLANLLSNAVKFTERGGIKVALALAPALDAEGRRRVRLEVSDTGPGFAADAAARLFERFEQADASITRRFGGAGLGLAIVRELVALMDGEIEVESRPGQGACFRVTLPLRPAAAPVRPAPDRPTVEQALRVLVAEDHPTNREVVRLMLEPFGFDLTFAEDGVAALTALEDPAGFDLVLMDMQMPRMDGLTATRRIRAGERGTRLPIAMLTANAGEEHRRAALEAGADVHVAKPLTVEGLLGGISRALERADNRLLQAS